MAKQIPNIPKGGGRSPKPTSKDNKVTQFVKEHPYSVLGVVVVVWLIVLTLG